MKLKNVDKNQSAITTKGITYNSQEIKRVIYDEDGDWQFLSGEDIDENDAVVLSIGEILILDSSLLDLPEVEENDILIRNSKNSTWQKLNQ
jgi:hypothetical protein